MQTNTAHCYVALCLQQDLQQRNLLRSDPFSRARDSEFFPVNVGVCADFLSRRT